MAVNNKLRLVKPVDHTDSLLFERRGLHRRRITGLATSLRWDIGESDQEHRNNRIAPLELADISDHGLGAFSSEPIGIGCPITVIVRPQYSARSYNLQGKVVRCIEKDGRHAIGIRFNESTPVSAA